MSRNDDVQAKVETQFDGRVLTVSCDFSSNPISLPLGAELSGYELTIGQEGILMGRLELREKLHAAVAALSVSPESLVMPE